MITRTLLCVAFLGSLPPWALADTHTLVKGEQWFALSQQLAHYHRSRGSAAAAPLRLVGKLPPQLYFGYASLKARGKSDRMRIELGKQLMAIQGATDWGQGVQATHLPHDQRLVYETQLTAGLLQFGRRPEEVLSGFARVPRVTVAGKSIGARDLFFEHFKAITPAEQPVQGVVAIAPGYALTGRSYYALADALNRAQFDVVLTDHQDAGFTRPVDGSPVRAQVDDDYGVARDTMATLAIARAIAGDKPVLLLAESMAARGAHLGVQLAAKGAWQTLLPELRTPIPVAWNPSPLPGPAEMRVLALSLHAGYVPNALNRINQFVSKLQGTQRVHLPPLNVPAYARDSAAVATIIQEQVASGSRLSASSIQAQTASTELWQGLPPEAEQHFFALNATGDSLCSFSAAQKLLGEQHVVPVPSRNHVFRFDPGAHDLIVRYVRKLLQAN